MRFSNIAALAASAASVAQANNMLTFKSLDDVDRVVHCTPNAGLRWPAPITVPAGKSVDMPMDHGWIGNCFAVHKGKPAVPGMLAEIAFDSWNGLAFYDVSAIVDPSDVDNVSEMYPAEHPGTPVSGCGVDNPFPCNNAYYLPDDIQTKSTNQCHIIVTMGKNGAGESKRDLTDYNTPSVKRDFVLGKF